MIITLVSGHGRIHRLWLGIGQFLPDILRSGILEGGAQVCDQVDQVVELVRLWGGIEGTVD